MGREPRNDRRFGTTISAQDREFSVRSTPDPSLLAVSNPGIGAPDSALTSLPGLAANQSSSIRIAGASVGLFGMEAVF